MTESESIDQELQHDRFGLVLVFVLLTLVGVGLLATDRFGRVMLGLLPAATLVVTLYAVRATLGQMLAVSAGLAVLQILVVGASINLRGDIPIVAASAVSIGLTIAVIGVAVRQIALHPRVHVQTILAGLTIYLQIGVMFSLVYAMMPLLLGAPFFAPSRTIVPTDYLYYSMATLTTVGYGDITSAEPVGRMLSVTEALIGQIYLVTVVAVIVGNLGAEKRTRARSAR